MHRRRHEESSVLNHTHLSNSFGMRTVLLLVFRQSANSQVAVMRDLRVEAIEILLRNLQSCYRLAIKETYFCEWCIVAKFCQMPK